MTNKEAIQTLREWLNMMSYDVAEPIPIEQAVVLGIEALSACQRAECAPAMALCDRMCPHGIPLDRTCAACAPAAPPEQERKLERCFDCGHAVRLHDQEGGCAVDLCDCINTRLLRLIDTTPATPSPPSPSDVEQAKQVFLRHWVFKNRSSTADAVDAFDALIAAVRQEEQERHAETVIAYEGPGIPPDSVPDGFSYSADVVRQKIAALSASRPQQDEIEKLQVAFVAECQRSAALEVERDQALDRIDALSRPQPSDDPHKRHTGWSTRESPLAAKPQPSDVLARPELGESLTKLWETLLGHCNWLDDSDREPEITAAIDALLTLTVTLAQEQQK